MVKYGKEFRKKQFTEWQDKYFCYKDHKKIIKKYLQAKEGLDKTDDFALVQEMQKWIAEFEESLDKDIKKVYIFFSNKEKVLYKKINEHLHIKPEYENLELGDFLNEYNQLKELSELSLNMSYFILYNLKAVIKILKKFDKKIVTPKNKMYYIKINYIQAKLEEQNSDILYLFKFKMIDEVNVLLDELINTLMKEFKANKDRLEEEEDTEVENKLIEQLPPMKEATTLIKKNHDQIKKNLRKVDSISAEVTKLFMPWKNFLRISSDVNSKFLQIQRESIHNPSDASSYLSRTASIVTTINTSKESKNNIFIVLSHGFLYMFSFSVIIPTSFDMVKFFCQNSEISKRKVYWGTLMMMAPLGTLFNYLYETFLFKKSTKKPIIISCFGLILGNLLYVISPQMNTLTFLFLGRFLCGLFNLRTHNKMYIINFLLQKDVSFYLTMFHTSSILGLGFGFLVNCRLTYIENNNTLFNRGTIGAIITMILSFILLIVSMFGFTEAHSQQFSMTSMQMFGDGIVSDEESTKNSINGDGDEMAKDVRKKTLILKDIDSKLGNFNRESKFDDTNLVSLSVNELASKEEGRLHSLLNVFIVYIIVIFTTKFINESIFINPRIYAKDFNNQEKWLTPIILGCSCFMILLVELALANKYKFITEKNLVIILLFLLLINNILFIIFHFRDIVHYFPVATATILASITEKYAAHLFLYIIPDTYMVCKIHGNVFINIFSMLARILCSGLLILCAINVKDVNIVIIYSFMAGLSFFSVLLYIIFFKEIRVKAINRIIKNIQSDTIKIATEV